MSAARSRSQRGVRPTARTNASAVAGRIFWEEGQLPFPEALEGRQLERLIGPITPTPLADGVRATIEHFRTAAS